MLTLKIQDSGRSYALELAARPAVLGSGDGVECRLAAKGVQPRHARIEFVDGLPQIVALGGGTLQLNGRPVRRAPLQPGDQLALGGAMVEVLAVAAAAPVPPEPARRVAAAAPAPRGGVGRWVVGGVVLAFGIGLLALVLSGRRPEAWDEFERLRAGGRFAAAREVLDGLRSGWAVDNASRTAEVDQAAARLGALESAVSARRAEIRSYAVEHSDRQLQLVLQRAIERAEDETVRRAAEIVRDSLPEVVADVVRKPPTPEPVGSPAAAIPAVPELPAAPAAVAAAQPRSTPSSTANASASPNASANAAPSPKADPAAAAGDAAVTLGSADAAAALADAERFAAQGQFVQAIDTLRTAIASVAVAEAPPLQTRLDAVRAAARTVCDEAVARAQALAQEGKAAEGLAVLDALAGRVPSSGEFAPLATARTALRNAAAAAARPAVAAAAPGAAKVDEAVRRTTLQALREQLDRIRAAETAGDFARCEALLREGSAMAKERDADFAARMQSRADEFALLGELHAATAALLQKGGAFAVALRDGAAGDLHGVDGANLLIAIGGADRRATWLDVAAPGIATVVQNGKLTGKPVLGAATLLYRNGETAEAEAMLARALKAEPALEAEVGRAIARGRGEDDGGRGYVLGKDGRFTSARAVDAEREAQGILAQLDAALRGKDHKPREQLAGELLAKGAASLPAVTRALELQVQRQVDAIEKSPFKKQLEKLDAQRRQLDDARTFAKDLIFDEVKYFYPYRPPQVSGERYAEYVKVQQEVDRRVEALRALWTDDRIKLKAPPKLLEDLEKLDWLAATLASLGAPVPERIVDVGWARGLPTDAITIQNYCRTKDEREELESWQRVEAYNEALRRTEKAISAGEFELLAITNAYRAMYRHRPLAAQVNICAAAHGHADEMSKLGYFSHFSPTPGRRSPFDRMKLAGYPNGASENIALVDGALGAHVAWLHSSGHHRNLLDPQHTEIGIGGIGRYWVQNFGNGQVWQEHPAWKALARKQ